MDVSCSCSDDEKEEIKPKLPELVSRTSNNALSMRLKTNPFGLTDTLIGQCYINFESLIDKTITYTSIDECVGVIFDELVHKEFTESLWYCGHQIGEVTGVLKMDQMPFFSQMKIGVLNNNGVSYVSKTFSSIN